MGGCMSRPQIQGYGGGQVTDGRKSLVGKDSTVSDTYSSIEDVRLDSVFSVTKAVACAGLESSKLIVAIDFTESNEWTGKSSRNKRSLHQIGDVQNPYEHVISIVGKTLGSLNEDNSIPCFGFGALPHDQEVFSFYQDRFCNGFEEVLNRYKEIVSRLQLGGPTSFAPIIEMATTIVEKSGGKHHVLLIITNGQENLGQQKQMTVDTIVKASKFALSVILVGVGDGPWDMVKDFVDDIHTRAFESLHFVNFTEIMRKNVLPSEKEAEFSEAVLMGFPSWSNAASISGGQSGHFPQRVPLPPPDHGESSSITTYEDQCCFICASKTPKDLAFGCGHQMCGKCSQEFYSCPVCRRRIHIRVKLIRESEQIWCSLCPTDQFNPKDMAFDCGHQTCSKCGKSLQCCPICRRTIKAKIKLY